MWPALMSIGGTAAATRQGYVERVEFRDGTRAARTRLTASQNTSRPDSKGRHDTDARLSLREVSIGQLEL
jgi:hypothetical protein